MLVRIEEELNLEPDTPFIEAVPDQTEIFKPVKLMVNFFVWNRYIRLGATPVLFGRECIKTEKPLVLKPGVVELRQKVDRRGVTYWAIFPMRGEPTHRLIRLWRPDDKEEGDVAVLELVAVAPPHAGSMRHYYALVARKIC